MWRSPWARTVRSKHCVAGERGQHVVEEADAGRDIGRARAIEPEAQGDIGFRGGAGEIRGAGHPLALAGNGGRGKLPAGS